MNRKLKRTEPRRFSSLASLPPNVEVLAIYNGKEGTGPDCGYQIEKVPGTVRRYRYVANKAHPMVVMVRDGGRILYLQPDQDFEFDLSSLPWILTWWEDRGEHPASAAVHDSACGDGGLFVSEVQDGHYSFLPVSRAVADRIFSQMCRKEPPEAGRVKAAMLWLGVRLGAAWRRVFG